MPIPDFQTLMLPVLRLADAGEIKVAEAVNRMADEFALTDQEREELLPSGRQAKIANRVHWSVTYLVKSGLVERPRRGYFAITPKGKSVLSSPPERIDIAFLSQFDGFDEFRTKANDDHPAEVEPTQDLAAGTPEERVEAAFEDLNAALREELLERILVMHPTAFEKLIVDLMLGMGYGANGSGERLGRTSDGGIDGVINEDVLGLDIIHLQAKRYATGNSIGVEKIREFAGALDERGATKGVFVTTSHFAPAATHYAQRSPKRLILIDGEELTRLLVKYGVAVRGYRVLELKKVDTDYFGEAEG
jgi:restriction system protein